MKVVVYKIDESLKPNEVLYAGELVLGAAFDGVDIATVNLREGVPEA